MPRRSAAAAAARRPRPGAIARRPSPTARPRVRSPRGHRPRPWPHPMTSWRPTCPSASSKFHGHGRRRLTRSASAPFRVGTVVPIRPVIRAPAGGGASTTEPRFPVAFRRPAFASRIVLRPPEDRPSSRSAHQTRMRLDPDGVVTFRTRQLRPGWVPSVPRGRWCAPARPNPSERHPPPHNGRPLSPAGATHHTGVTMTRRHRGFTSFTRPVFPSL